MTRFFAYVDPGTGSFALQAVIGAVMGVSYVARTHIRSIVNKFRKGPQAGKPDEN